MDKSLTNILIYEFIYESYMYLLEKKMFWEWEGIRRRRDVQTNSLENEDVLWLDI